MVILHVHACRINRRKFSNYQQTQSFFLSPARTQRARAPATCQHPTLWKHTDKHKGTNIEQNFKSPSTTSQPPPGMGLIYMKKGNRIEEEINHKIIKKRKWG